MTKMHIVLLVAICGLVAQARANTIGITYSFAGAQAGPPVVSGTTVTTDDVATGSILSGDANLNAVWKPITWSDHSVIDLTTGLLNGVFSMKFADGNSLSGTVLEDVSKVVPTGTGPITGIILTFTGGTGEFAGASGSASGGGIIGSNGWTISGSGTLNAPAIPEAGSGPLLFGGLALLIGTLRNSKVKRSARSRLSI